MSCTIIHKRKYFEVFHMYCTKFLVMRKWSECQREILDLISFIMVIELSKGGIIVENK